VTPPKPTDETPEQAIEKVLAKVKEVVAVLAAKTPPAEAKGFKSSSTRRPTRWPTPPGRTSWPRDKVSKKEKEFLGQLKKRWRLTRGEPRLEEPRIEQRIVGSRGALALLVLPTAPSARESMSTNQRSSPRWGRSGSSSIGSGTSPGTGGSSSTDVDGRSRRLGRAGIEARDPAARARGRDRRGLAGRRRGQGALHPRHRPRRGGSGGGSVGQDRRGGVGGQAAASFVRRRS